MEAFVASTVRTKQSVKGFLWFHRSSAAARNTPTLQTSILFLCSLSSVCMQEKKVAFHSLFLHLFPFFWPSLLSGRCTGLCDSYCGLHTRQTCLSLKSPLAAMCLCMCMLAGVTLGQPLRRSEDNCVWRPPETAAEFART